MKDDSLAASRRLPAGAEVVPGGVHFRVWAPARKSIEVLVESPQPLTVELAKEPSGYFSGLVPGVTAGARYKYRIDGGGAFPDPASRYQPEGPHTASEVVDPALFRWTDAGWPGVRIEGQVIYEMHVGTFTPEGTWAAAQAKLPHLADTGITVLEIMPLHDCPGRFNWGYDGVHLYAPAHQYGTPDDVRAFVDKAHSLGIGVIHDVVYNHLGPDGNYLGEFSDLYFTDRHRTDWGSAINFDSDGAGPVRDFFAFNAACWIDEFHMDGLRLDATQNIYDDSEPHILAEITRVARKAAGRRAIVIVAENEPQETRLLRPVAERGYGLDALWNDDFHHSAMVAMTGRIEAYYTDYRGAPQEFVSAAKHGFLFQGQRYAWQDKRRGAPTRGLAPAAFINFIQNHDQVANSVSGLRCHRLTDSGTCKALTALTLLAPGTPMLFQGQEFCASAPFQFFADHKAGLAGQVASGRAEFMRQFAAAAMPEMARRLPDPGDPRTFERCRLDWSELESNAPMLNLHRDLLRLRKAQPVFRAQKAGALDGAILGESAFVLRFAGDGGDDRLLVVNLGAARVLSPSPEPLLAPPEGKHWSTLWSSEHPDYGGCGTPDLEADEGWRIPARAAVVLHPSGGAP
jgi:maltooligosyltrehalose trehalohydrolase